MPDNYFISVISITVLTLIINLPFGYLRVKTKKLSIQWFLYIHLPIPLIFVFRKTAGISYHAIPVFVMAAVAGQILGGRFRQAFRS
ncbi:MAG: hypothetical protein V3T96_04225 [Thermodesulfobacteriota bacterium]